jgi:hypothetical protein
MKMTKSLTLATAVVAMLFGGGQVAKAAIITGTVSDFTSPDDLLLDPATSVIAVNVNGGAAAPVNGVNFLADSGTVGGVTATTSSTNSLPTWVAAPAFTGSDPTSVANFNTIMQSIRWSLAPATVNVDITGLTPGSLYNVQLLFSEGGPNDRRFDIGVDGALVVDDFFTTGTTPATGRVYSGDFDPGADGELNILLGQEPLPSDPNNTPFTGADNNPILQAVVIHEVIPEPSSLLLSLLGVAALTRRRR